MKSNIKRQNKMTCATSASSRLSPRGYKCTANWLTNNKSYHETSQLHRPKILFSKYIRCIVIKIIHLPKTPTRSPMILKSSNVATFTLFLWSPSAIDWTTAWLDMYHTFLILLAIVGTPDESLQQVTTLPLLPYSHQRSPSSRVGTSGASSLSKLRQIWAII